MNELTTVEINTAAHLSQDVYDDPCDFLQLNDEARRTLWIAFEGSDELIDWRRNAEFLLTSSDTHLGFQNYATLLMAQMLAQGVNVNSHYRVILCGHSLGGAVATIVAAELQSHLTNLQLITFGSPRPGGRRFAQRLQVPHLRLVHGDDVVPRLPSPLLGFRHAGEATVLTVPGDRPTWAIRDHAMNGYINALRQQQREAQ